MNLEIKEPSLFDMFDAIEAVSSRNEKERLLFAATEQQKNLIELALNPYRQFHTTKKYVNSPLNTSIKGTDKGLYDYFIVLCDYLQHTNHCSESDLKVSLFYGKCNPQQGKWFERILNKELRFGLMAKSVNKVFPKLIPAFDVALCNKVEKDLSNVDFSRPIWAEYKYDGFRTVGQFGDIIEILGRSGKEISNKNFYNKMIEWKSYNHPCYGGMLKDLMIDGEGYITGSVFEDLSSVLRTEDKRLPEGTKFVLFDAISLNDWRNKNKTEDFFHRRQQRRIIVQELGKFFEEPIGKKVTSAEEVWTFYDEAINAGFEGLVLKYEDEPYPFKRSDAMLKVKLEDKLDACIIGFYEGENSFVGRLGGFIVELEDGKQVRIGGGYKKWQRFKYWENPQQYVGQWIIVKYTQKTQDGSLRHPRFGGFRDSKEIS
jgi:DNA ligase-1